LGRFKPAGKLTNAVTAGLVAAIDVWLNKNRAKKWMPGIKPGMTVRFTGGN
jgi:hypothetical protein